jgi:hypothetical protein
MSTWVIYILHKRRRYSYLTKDEMLVDLPHFLRLYPKVLLAVGERILKEDGNVEFRPLVAPWP